MVDNFLLVGKQVAILFILISVGAASNRLKLLKKESIPSIVDFVLLIVTPCLIVEAFQRPFNSQLMVELEKAFLIAVAFHVAAIFLAKAFIHCPNPSQQRVLRFSVIFSNAGFMSIPLEQALLGSEGVFYGAAVVAVFNLILWSYGLLLMCGDMRQIKARTFIFNPGTVGLMVGLTFFSLSVRLPSILMEPIHSLANLNTPLAMVVIGYYLAEADLTAIFRSPAGFVMLFLRLIVVPLAVIALLWELGWNNPTMAVACVIASSAPVAAVTTMFSSKFGQDTQLSVGSVSLSTLLSLITMPLIIGFAQWLFNH